MVEAFKNIKPQYGKYTVTSNREVYAGMDWTVNMTKIAVFFCFAGQGDDESEDPVKEANILEQLTLDW